MKKKLMTVMCAMMLAVSAMPAMMPVSVFAASEKTSSEVTIRYEDGVDNSIFDAVEIVVKKGANVPDIGLTPVRQGYVFDGWTPSANVTADSDMTFTAKWVGDDSLTDDDRADIKAEADKTRSQYSVDDVNGSVTAGYANTSASVSGSSDTSSDKTGTDTSTTTTTDTSTTSETSAMTATTDGKQDAYTDDVDTGDINIPLYIGGMIVAVAVAGSVVAIRCKKSIDK